MIHEMLLRKDPEALAKLDQETDEIVVDFETRIEEADKEPEEVIKPLVEPKKEPVIVTPEVSDDIISDIQEEKKHEETKVEEKPVKPVIIQQDSESIEELKNEILSLKQIVLELQTKVENLQEDTTKSNFKLDAISKKLFPKWFKITVLILFFVSIFIAIFIPLSIYYPDAPVISQIAWLFDKIPFLGGRSLLEFLQAFFERLFLV